MYFPCILIPIILHFSKVSEGVPVLEFGEKPTENGQLDVVNLELPTSHFSVCFQLFMMQRIDLVRIIPFFADNGLFGIRIAPKGLDHMLYLFILKKTYQIPIEKEELGLLQWTKGCFTLNQTSYELFINGLSIRSGEREDVYKDTNVTTLNVSKLSFSTYVRHKISNLKVWNIAIPRTEMERLTEQCNVTDYPTDNIAFAIDDTTEISILASQLSAASIKEVAEEELCQLSKLHFFRNIKSTFDEATSTCEALGGKMYLPLTGKDFEQFQAMDSKLRFWVPIIKAGNDGWINYYTHENITNNIPWRSGEPNGGRLEPCVFVWHKRMYDAPCSALAALRSFICHFTSRRKFKLRGLHLENLRIDTEYSIDHFRTFNDRLVFRGLLYGHWMLYGIDNDRHDFWFITKTQDFPVNDQSISESDILAKYYLYENSIFLPIGKKEWWVGLELDTFKTLKFTQVRQQKLGDIAFVVTFSYLTFSVWQGPIHMFKWPLH